MTSNSEAVKTIGRCYSRPCNYNLIMKRFTNNPWFRVIALIIGIAIILAFLYYSASI